ncbi:MAG: hypothetical protein E7280_06800 [Lachnospiraceae bacterium]|nr:hypothetical protein [Lachnospiraceae bacterium]
MEVYGVFMCLALPLATRYPKEAGVAILLDVGITCLCRALRKGKREKKKGRLSNGICYLEGVFSWIVLSKASAAYIHQPSVWPVLGLIFLMFLFQGRQKNKGYRLPGEDSFRKLWGNITVIGILVAIGLQYKNIRWNIFFDLPRVCPWVVIVLAAMFWILLLPYQVCLPAWGLFYLTVKVLFHIVPPKVLAMDGQPFLNLGRCAGDIAGGGVRMEVPAVILYWGMLFFLFWEGGDRLWKKRAEPIGKESESS